MKINVLCNSSGSEPGLWILARKPGKQHFEMYEQLYDEGAAKSRVKDLANVLPDGTEFNVSWCGVDDDGLMED